MVWQKNTKQGKSMVGKMSESVVVCCYFQNGDWIVKVQRPGFESVENEDCSVVALWCGRVCEMPSR